MEVTCSKQAPTFDVEWEQKDSPKKWNHKIYKCNAVMCFNIRHGKEE